jgi:alanine dehydrogenase
MGGVSGVAPANVVVVGGGTVGKSAASVAAGMGAHVSCFDIDTHRLGYLDDVWGTGITTLYSNALAVAEATAQADVVIGAVLIPGARAPHIITREMIQNMRPGAVVVDVSIDQGGCVGGIKSTSHAEPTYLEHGVVHYSVTNIPAAVPRTSTYALTNSTLFYARKLAGMGADAAVESDTALAKGLNIADGEIKHPAVRDAFPHLA